MRAKDEEELRVGSLKSLSAEDVEKLATLSVVSRVLNTSYDLQEGLWSVLDAVMSALSADRGFILLSGPDGQFRQEIALDKSVKPWGISFSYSHSLFQQCVDKREPILMLDAAKAPKATLSAVTTGTRSVMLYPILRQDNLVGVFYVDSLLKAACFRDNELRLLGIIADMVAVFLERTHNAAALVHKSRELELALSGLKAANDMLVESAQDTIYRLSRAAEFRDDEGGEHVQRVSHYCEAVALQLGFSPEEAAHIRIASQLHDVGKVGIPDSILLKPGRYTDYEREVMKQHTVIGAKILSGSNNAIIRLAEEMALTHHEKWNGSGYPRGQSGAKIPLSGRIVAVADVFDALTTERRYKKAWTTERALELVAQEAGSHFDPDVSKAFLALGDKVEAIRSRYQPAPEIEEDVESVTERVLQTRAQGRELVEPIRQAVEALARDEKFPDGLRLEAVKSARLLTGLLGSLGEGVDTIRRLEGHLKRHDLASEQAPRLAALLSEVEAALSEERTVVAGAGTDTILLVEPDPYQREALVIEASNRGLTIVEAKDVAAAKRAVQVRLPELVIVEVAQADADEFLQWLRLEHPSIPLVVLSSEGDFSRRLEVTRKGDALYLHKPLPASAIFDEIDDRLGREGPRQLKVLALDDDKVILKVIARVLSTHGFEVQTISDPLKLWSTLSDAAPDILLLDLEMPTVNGYDICKVLRSDPHRGHLPIIVLTGHQDIETYQHALEAGADDVLVKPLEPARLISRISSRLGRDNALRKSSARDPVTGLMTLRSALRTAGHLFALAVRNGTPFSLCALKLDHFDALVQSYGRLRAAEILRQVALVLQRRARTEDIVVRYGSDCFLLGLYGSPADATTKLIESLNARLAQEDLGVCCTPYSACYPEDGTHLNELLDKVNKALGVSPSGPIKPIP